MSHSEWEVDCTQSVLCAVQRLEDKSLSISSGCKGTWKPCVSSSVWSSYLVVIHPKNCHVLQLHSFQALIFLLDCSRWDWWWIRTEGTLFCPSVWLEPLFVTEDGELNHPKALTWLCLSLNRASPSGTLAASLFLLELPAYLKFNDFCRALLNHGICQDCGYITVKLSICLKNFTLYMDEGVMSSS